MDFTAISELISTIGFPIVMCILLLYVMKKSDERHAEQIAQIMATVNNNTETMNKLITKLDERGIG